MQIHSSVVLMILLQGLSAVLVRSDCIELALVQLRFSYLVPRSHFFALHIRQYYRQRSLSLDNISSVMMVLLLLLKPFCKSETLKHVVFPPARLWRLSSQSGVLRQSLDLGGDGLRAKCDVDAKQSHRQLQAVLRIVDSLSQLS
jgi:hypothetical protein